MNKGSIRHAKWTYEFPAKEPPSWASLVERWYQLDAYAFGLPQGYAAVGKNLGRLPDFLILASPEGSNRTDSEFAQLWMKTGVGSPSKFVHTLPNSRSAALLQVMDWTGPLLCLQNDPVTIAQGLAQAIEFAIFGEAVWVATVVCRERGQFEAHFFAVDASSEGDLAWSESRGEANACDDSQLLALLDHKVRASTLRLSDRYVLGPIDETAS